MKRIGCTILFLLSIQIGWCQYTNIDSLKNIINQRKEDTNTVKAFVQLADNYGYISIDSAIAYVQQGLLLANKLNYTKGEANCYLVLGGKNSSVGNYSQAIAFIFKALHIYEQLKDEDGINAAHLLLQAIYRSAGDYKNSLEHAFKARHLAEANDRKGKIIFTGARMIPLVLAEIGETYQEMNQLDSALLYTKKAIQQNLTFNGAKWNFPIYLLGKIQAKQGNHPVALKTFRTALPLAVQNGLLNDTLPIYNSISALYKKLGKVDSAIYYAKTITSKTSALLPAYILLDATTILAQTYKLTGNKDSTLKYVELSNVLKDSIHSREKQIEFQSITFNEQIRQQEISAAQVQFKNRLKILVLSGSLLILILLSVILWRNNQLKQKAKLKIEDAYNQLKATQAQLVQREKMASLGELTAGIAHEIQNPLNFVNNFSEVNTELLAELEQEAQSGNLPAIIQLAAEMKDNEQKINYHGKRADTIVKNMMQHSRTTTGVKERINVNALADEYLQLSYHGIRAKDKEFKATIRTNYEEEIGKVEGIPQDIGRVLLNLFNNAFYSIQQKKQQLNGTYEPTLTITTKRNGSKIAVLVQDNGLGIPPKEVNKIFQPFYTTKPTGQGTGLGLSLSFDIIKAHGGELQVETKDGEYATFIIELPV